MLVNNQLVREVLGELNQDLLALQIFLQVLVDLLEICELLLVDGDKKVFQREVPLHHGVEYSLLWWQKGLDELRHLLDHLQELLILFNLSKQLLILLRISLIMLINI